MKRDPNTPLLAVLVLSSLLMGVVLLPQLLTRQDLYLVDKLNLGVDYQEVYRGSQKLRAGLSPYDVERYVYPPLPAMLGVPATWLTFDTVKYGVALAVLVSVAAALFLLHRIFAPPDWRADGVFLLASLGILSLSYPFHFLFDRGNLDGFALLLTALGLFLLRGSGWLAGVLFGLAVAVKLYPVLVVLPLAAKLRWKPLAAMAACLLVLLVLTPNLWLTFLQDRVLSRGAQFRIDENGSIANTCTFLGRYLAIAFGLPRMKLALAAAALARPLYLALLGSMIWRDARRRDSGRRALCADVALYFPFMVAVPNLAYHYELVWLLGLIPVLGWRWTKAVRRTERLVLSFLVGGIALSQFQAAAAKRLIGTIDPDFVPGFGLLLVMIGVVALKWITPTTERAQATPA